MYKKLFAVCIALFIAVQAAFSAFAQPDFGNIASGEFMKGQAFGKSDWNTFTYGRIYRDKSAANEYLNSVKPAVLQMQQKSGFVRPTEYQRAAIVLSAYGIADKEIVKLAVYNNSSLSKQGINAYIWAVITANCTGIYSGDSDCINTIDSITSYLLQQQLADGGFNLSGTGADADITAAAIYALAPLASNNPEIQQATDRALKALTALQNPDGGFSSMGNPNCESTAQAIIAFCAMGVDDNRLTAAIEKLESYKTADGYSHLEGGNTNAMATTQAYMAKAAYQLGKQGRALFNNCVLEHQKGYFVLDNLPVNAETDVTESSAVSSTALPCITSVPALSGDSEESIPATGNENSTTTVSQSADSNSTPPVSVNDITSQPESVDNSTSQPESVDNTTTLESNDNNATQPENADNTTALESDDNTTTPESIDNSTTPPDKTTVNNSDGDIDTSAPLQSESGNVTTLQNSGDVTTKPEVNPDNSNGNSGKSWIYPLVIVIICAVLAVVLVIVSRLKAEKAAKVKKYLPVIITAMVFAVIIGILFFTGDSDNNTSESDLQGDTQSNYSDNTNTDSSFLQGYCSFSIDAQNAGAGIIFSGDMKISQGDSVYDVLCRICGENNIQLESSYSAAFGSYYVEGIADIYEFDYGPSSGWIYKVNGNMPNRGCSAYTLNDADRVEFIYTVSYDENTGE